MESHDFSYLFTDSWKSPVNVYKIIEDGREAVRNIRRDANDNLKMHEKEHDLSEDNLRRAMDNIQEMTDDHIKEFNMLQDSKEKEIMD